MEPDQYVWFRSWGFFSFGMMLHGLVIAETRRHYILRVRFHDVDSNTKWTEHHRIAKRRCTEEPQP